MYKVAIIGCGARSVAHIESYKHIKNARVTACYDLDIKTAQRRAFEYGLKAYQDLNQMLCDEKPDIVHIITPPSERVELMRTVSNNNVKLCTVEKPICVDVRDWKALCDFSKKTRTKFAVSHQVGWHEDLARCVEAARSGVLGKIEVVTMTCGMDITNQGTHCLHYGMLLMPDNIRVTNVFGSASGWDIKDIRHPAPLSTQAMLQFSDGTLGLWASGENSPRHGDPSTTWQHICVGAYGPCGRVYFEEFRDWDIKTPQGHQHGNFGGMDVWPERNTAAQAGFHQAMIHWDQTGEAPSTHLDRSLYEWKIVLALYYSSLYHIPVNIDQFEPEDNLCDILFARLKKENQNIG